jgi:hypothetical protein
LVNNIGSIRRHSSSFDALFLSMPDRPAINPVTALQDETVSHRQQTTFPDLH